jgi:hypothetical protein
MPFASVLKESDFYWLASSAPIASCNHEKCQLVIAKALFSKPVSAFEYSKGIADHTMAGYSDP